MFLLGREVGRVAGKTVNHPATLLLLKHIEDAKLPTPVQEYQFALGRRWRFDFCWPRRRLAVELEGGLYSAGRHVRGQGYEADLDKYNAATILGWHILRFSIGMVEDGRAITTIREVLENALPG